MTKRSLMLAGGGLKIAFQSGVLQVWLDEAGIEFDHGDGVSAATFNLAMWVQGFSGTQIADNWRRFKPMAAVDVNWLQLLKVFYAESFFELNPFRKKFFREWGLDFEKIRASPRLGTFNWIVAALVSASAYRRRHVHRCCLEHRHQSRGSGPAWRRRALGDLDHESTRAMAQRLRWKLLRHLRSDE